MDAIQPEDLIMGAYVNVSMDVAGDVPIKVNHVDGPLLYPENYFNPNPYIGYTMYDVNYPFAKDKWASDFADS